jgi:molybdenum cofactor synthesis domain-containing protein
MRVAILTISDTGHRGERADTSGDEIAAWAVDRAYTVVDRRLVPDETGGIAAVLIEWTDTDAADLILTTGGTGLTPRDVTPEATRAVLEREAPGIAEAVRRYGADNGVPTSVLSRGLAGTAGRTLIVNLPGSTGGVRDALAVLGPLLPHVVSQLRGGDH